MDGGNAEAASSRKLGKSSAAARSRCACRQEA
jgi:hypothetical protein